MIDKESEENETVKTLESESDHVFIELDNGLYHKVKLYHFEKKKLLEKDSLSSHRE